MIGPLDSARLDRTPPGVALSKDGRFVTPRSGFSVATPTIKEQIIPAERPATALSFPPHPFGTALLYARAGSLLRAAEAWDGLTTEEGTHLENHLWRQAVRLFRPGRSIRAALDDFFNPVALLPAGTAPSDLDERADEERLAWLAVWAVAEAARHWES